MNSIKENFEFMKQKVAEKRRNDKLKKAQRAKNLQIKDIYTNSYTHKGVTLPYPNAFVNDLITLHFSNMEAGEDLTMREIGAMIWMLENSKDISMRDMSKDDLLRKGDERLVEIPAGLEPEFIACINEMFEAVKKKASDWQMKEIMKLAKFLDGDLSALASLKNLAEPLMTTT